ncbi:metal-binding protein [Croceicoccus estronivorus]|uniref:ComEC/Rec2 family competence protein n=1 Tax=Croceicoccus estronivorus TaxID=1172626 RepID=UPI00082F3EFD|nr:ComEC/Rec2 family competence protein [Croceicoccus estronivorus]OCC23198.1 metal-binding protein [Croceicoccus estronivorus]
MAGDAPFVPLSGEETEDDAAVQRPWRKYLRLSSVGDAMERFLGTAGLDRGPWVAVGLAAGIALWFGLSDALEWGAVLGICGIIVASVVFSRWGRDNFVHLRSALVIMAIMIAAGVVVAWERSVVVGVEPIAHPMTATVEARILERDEQPALQRVRLVLATREPGNGRAIKIRVNLPEAYDQSAIREGAIIRAKVRLMPPAPPMLPGAYNFARTAWFNGFAATGNVIGAVQVLQDVGSGGWLTGMQRSLSAHVRGHIDGSPGTIAAALASGDRGAIAERDEQAMRDSGLTHLLSISGLHVSAVIGAAYLLAIRLLAAWPWLALRVRLPLLAAGVGAICGVGYTLLTGAEVPTIRSCVGAILVLLALALGRDPLSLRMVAVAAIVVLLLWPEALVGPSFQMSFAAVIAIIALHSAAPVRAFLAPKEEGRVKWIMRRAAMLLITGLVIELALMPIGLFHFHRAGVYGALANVAAIPLTTFITMPLIAVALVLDLVGLGAPIWWLVGKSLELLLAIAHWTASQPGAVTRMPSMPPLVFVLFAGGGLWLALWRGHARLFGLIPVATATVLVQVGDLPDVLISGDGRHVGILGEGDRLLVLRDSRSSYARDNLLELSGMDGDPLPFDQWPGASCSRDFCSLTLVRDGHPHHILAARSHMRVEERALAAACERADIVIADRSLPHSCHPRWLKADRRSLSKSGGLAIYLADHRIRTVAETQGDHGWWKPRTD